MFSNEINEYFTQLVNTPSPSGYEQPAQELFSLYARRYADSVEEDRFGNVIAHLSHPGKPRLMLSAHIDEIGFLVKHIDEEGFLYMVPIGGVDTLLLPGARLALHHGDHAHLGIVGRKPIHLLNEMERGKVQFEDLWVDCGFTSRRHAECSVSVGDPITFCTDPREMSDDLLCTRSADNKVGNAMLLELMKRLQGADCAYDLFFVSTRQEEIGLRGAITAANTIKPDFCIVLDATHATDYPTTKPSIHGSIALGAGPAISVSPDTHQGLREALLAVARREQIPHQIEAHPNATGTEAKAIQLQSGGICTATLSYPVRYMHSPSEIVSKNDVCHALNLLNAFLAPSCPESAS